MLCSACKYDPTCIYEIESETAILQCEQFELGIRESAAGPPSGQRPPQPGSFRFAGLCANCENRDTCIYPKPEGGVWRCEEYL
jgi:hypothetical protein